jgi:carboxypeptidase T
MKNKIIILLSFIIGSFINSHATILTYTGYRDLTQVNSALETLHNTYPAITDLVTIGTSVEGRPIMALKISNPPSVDDPAKGDVVYVGLHHAREWISVEVCLYIADQLLHQYATNAGLQTDLNAIQLWIVPVVNPDGFVYTHDVFRNWRKNRRDNGDGTYGVDLNRNWGYQWGLSSGSSGVTSDDTYRGTASFSEPEVDDLKDFLNARNNLKCFVSYHSYSELYLRPWAYTTSDAPGETTLASIAQRNIARVAAVHGHTYSESIWYTSSGEAADYLWGEKRVAAFTSELRPTLYGVGGFELPPSEILPCAEENYPAAVALIHDAAISHIYIRDHSADTGQEPSAIWTGSGWSHDFWVSPDIWTIPEELNQGAFVTLYVRVHNNTPLTQNNVTVDAYYNDPRISLEFPNPNSNLIGTQTVNLAPGSTTLSYIWTVPTGTNIWGERHWCVGVVIRHADDMPLTNQVQRTSNIGCRNFNTTEVVVGGSILVAAENYLNVPAEIKYIIDTEKLPDGIKIRPVQKPLERSLKPTPGTIRKARLLEIKGTVLEPGERAIFRMDIITNSDYSGKMEFDLDVGGALVPLVAGERKAMGNGYSYKVKLKK